MHGIFTAILFHSTGTWLQISTLTFSREKAQNSDFEVAWFWTYFFRWKLRKYLFLQKSSYIFLTASSGEIVVLVIWFFFCYCCGILVSITFWIIEINHVIWWREIVLIWKSRWLKDAKICCQRCWTNQRILISMQ